jgi:hypothetical protein
MARPAQIYAENGRDRHALRSTKHPGHSGCQSERYLQTLVDYLFSSGNGIPIYFFSCSSHPEGRVRSRVLEVEDHPWRKLGKHEGHTSRRTIPPHYLPSGKVHRVNTLFGNRLPARCRDDLDESRASIIFRETIRYPRERCVHRFREPLFPIQAPSGDGAWPKSSRLGRRTTKHSPRDGLRSQA